MISLELVSYVVSAVQAVTDWVSAFVPCYIVSKLQMPRRTKIAIVFMLGLGILASIATIIRLPYLRYYDTAKYPNDFLCKTKYHQHALKLTQRLTPFSSCWRYCHVL